jgi:hypothetical protein
VFKLRDMRLASEEKIKVHELVLVPQKSLPFSGYELTSERGVTHLRGGVVRRAHISNSSGKDKKILRLVAEHCQLDSLPAHKSSGDGKLRKRR